MILMSGKVPQKYYVACSGGVDSMAVLSFLQNSRGPNRPMVAYFNHGTAHSESAEGFVAEYCRTNNLELAIGKVSRPRDPAESLEEYWRNERYRFFHSLSAAVITAHNIEDCMETWIFTCLNGNGKIIPYSNGNVIRPFRKTSKAEFISWCTRRQVAWQEDVSNTDVKFCRNRIRHRIMPEALMINPGLAKVIRKKIEAESSPHCA